MKYGQLVVGPAGSGKSTYCATIQEHCKTIGRNIFVVNLDPAAETFRYECALDVRELISVGDVMEDEELALGPNGALIYCMEYLVENIDWLHQELNEGEDDYFLFDCPGIQLVVQIIYNSQNSVNRCFFKGQIELYSHLPVMRQIADALKQWDFNICTTFLLDTTFCLDVGELSRISILMLCIRVFD